ncbi:hypothetical protein [Kroppenstedtia eburnea]|uniref:Uncharacterized protein n=1 Tax=Kroppenstedtia eburnea TaxID=714067 RepID=A0A1N7LBG2_9BACL|nr:hypothetical protein [Kroppenstedtia eburnea]QKI81429.1 hypothetical protein GXN75_05130 [Kroppenstedtia eburnea]SIS71196.1 hypothetical protein SAMN05421790_10472 [Kroppenstedtia eburnea]
MNKRFLPVEYHCKKCGGRFLMTEYPADLCWFCGSDKITPHGKDLGTQSSTAGERIGNDLTCQ